MKTTIKTRSLKLMPDYDCHPLWEQNDSGTTNVSPSDLPISLGLQDALNSWARQYDDMLNRDNPSQSSFRTPEALVAFKNEGENLFDRLKMELGDSYVISIRLLC